MSFIIMLFVADDTYISCIVGECHAILRKFITAHRLWASFSDRFKFYLIACSYVTVYAIDYILPLRLSSRSVPPGATEVE